MANVLNLQADTAEMTQETKRSDHTSIVWCSSGSTSHSLFVC